MNSKRALLILACVLAGCERRAEIYRPPIQRSPYEVTESKTIGHYVTMSADNALDYIVSGVLPELHGNQWRWTLQEPVLRFQVPRTNGLKFHMDYTVPELTFRETGPVKIEIFIGACLLDTISLQKDAVTSYEKEVPPECLNVTRPVVVRMRVDKTWQGAGDRQPRGFILTGAGFVE